MTDANNTIKILFEVSSTHAADVLLPLASACNRNSIPWACFFTGNGVKVLADEKLSGVLAGAVKAVACEASWDIYMVGHVCPVEIGSQTTNSALFGEADKVVSI